MSHVVDDDQSMRVRLSVASVRIQSTAEFLDATLQTLSMRTDMASQA